MTDVVDGDTVHVKYKGTDTTIRVIGIDTPETVHPSVPDECGGEAASQKAKNLLSGQKVRLVFDPSQGRTDAYDRTLAYLELPSTGDYGLTMIKKGLAAEYTYDTAYQRQTTYRSAESSARQSNTGTWGACGDFDTPSEPTSTTTTPPAPTGQGPAGNCAPGYDPCVPSAPPDVDCADVDGPISVTGDDPHSLDAEGDGIACE